jgi:hypothetical protein
VPFEVRLDEGVQQGEVLLGQRALPAQDVAQRLGLVQHPRVHGGHERVAGDEVHPHRQGAEQQVAVAVGGGHGRALKQA